VRNKIQYFTLLVLTGDVINDFKETKDLLYWWQISTVIVDHYCGVGLADFTQIEALDADSGEVKNSQGKAVKRDIVQFVSLRDYSKPLKDANGHVIGFTYTRFAKLSKENLKEIPQQFMSYIKAHNLSPLKLTAIRVRDSFHVRICVLVVCICAVFIMFMFIVFIVFVVFIFIVFVANIDDFVFAWGLYIRVCRILSSINRKCE
ncbi:copine VIII isoform 2, partial [Reticulomyxa filosa]